LERSLAIKEKVLGPEHPATNAVRSNLSRLLLLTGVLTEALALGKTALAAHDKALGRDHTWTKDSVRVTAEGSARLRATKEERDNESDVTNVNSTAAGESCTCG
jgi:hypothetical protein